MLAVQEKKDQVVHRDSMENFEAQLIAAALAAVQANEELVGIQPGAAEISAAERRSLDTVKLLTPASFFLLQCVTGQFQMSQKPRSASAADAAGGCPLSTGVVQSGPMYMLRVVGDNFSFYSMQPQQRLMAVLAEHEAAPAELKTKQQLPITRVLKLDEAGDTFMFAYQQHRDIILRMLSAILGKIQQ